LPKAHVEAPVYGSMILAGVLLKMGGYGLIRLIMIFFKLRIKYNYYIISLRIVGGMLIRLVCLVQVDIKILVAYSSVVHINLIVCSLLTIFKLGFIRSYIIIISHGLCSSGLFYIVDLYYKRTFSRLLFLNKGMMGKLRILSF
jgi:NADH-ubiquinone oxidoreductase chain 4